MVSLGAKGAMLAAVDEPTVRIEAPVVPVVSAVGAGDSLVGATAMALAEGADLVDAARRGVAVGQPPRCRATTSCADSKMSRGCYPSSTPGHSLGSSRAARPERPA